jgi:hypothetical protein
MKLEIDISDPILEKLRRFCQTHDVSERDVIEHALEEWYASAAT